MNRDLLARTLRQLFRELLGMPDDSVRPADQEAPIGVAMFATLKIIALGEEGFDDRELDTSLTEPLELTETVQGARRVTASVNFYGAGAYSMASRVSGVFQTSNAIDKCQAAKVGFIKASPIRDLTALVDTEWEERAQLDVEFYIIVKEETTGLKTYGKFPITVTIDNLTSTNEVNEP